MATHTDPPNCCRCFTVHIRRDESGTAVNTNARVEHEHGGIEWPGWSASDAALVFLAATGGLNLWRIALFAMHAPARVTATLWAFGSTAVLLGIAVFGVRRFGRGSAPASLGLRWPRLTDIPLGICCGIALFLGTKWLQDVINAQLSDWVRWYASAANPVDLNQGPWLLAAFARVLVVPFGEETLFRGFVYQGLRAKYSIWVAAALSGGLFAAIHINPAVMPAIFIDGLALALAFEWRRSLALPIIIHASILGCFFLESLL